MSKIIVFAEFTNGKLKSGTLELLSAGKAAGAELSAMAFGPGAKALAKELGAFGAKKVFVCENDSLKNYNSELFTDIVSSIIKKSGASTVLASGSMSARDLFPRVAARLGAGVIGDCTGLTISGNDVSVQRPLYSAKANAKVDFQNCDIKIVLMRPNQLTISAPDANSTAEVVEETLAAKDLKTIVKQVVTGASTKLDLTEANIIVSGGRGMKGAEHFKLLQDLAEVLGATVGASRAVVDAGWVPHSMQVGQTGKTVAPTLYIAAGISGAIQHLAGMSSSKVIVAINKDPEAPIFKKATYGIVGDAFEVLPLLTQEFKKILQ